MARKKFKDNDIEDLLEKLEGGLISEDDAESDDEDLDYYPNIEDIRAALESDEEERQLYAGNSGNSPNPQMQNEDDPPLVSFENETEDDDPPLVIEGSSGPAQNPLNRCPRPMDSARLTWRKRSLDFREENIRFQKENEHSPEVMALETPYQIFSYFLRPIF
ncbi:hypothetical protein O0L34_g12645 [Tuta absoluta]|nr:hypothetical protein O0L34_g12645 [Tuta absoluta]